MVSRYSHKDHNFIYLPCINHKRPFSIVSRKGSSSMPPVSPDVWAALHVDGLVHVLINLPHRVQELRLQHLLQRGQLGGGDLQQGLHSLQHCTGLTSPQYLLFCSFSSSWQARLMSRDSVRVPSISARPCSASVMVTASSSSSLSSLSS